MPYADYSSHNHLAKLMDLSAVLADLTRSPGLAGQIPACVAGAFELEALTLAVVRRGRECAGEAALLHSTLLGSTGSGDFVKSVLAIEEQGRNHRAGLGMPNRFQEEYDAAASLAYAAGSAEGCAAYAAGFDCFAYAAGSDLPGFPRAVVFGQGLGERQHLYVMVHQRGNAAILTAGQNAGLALVAGLLAKLLRCMLSWQDRPEILGRDFAHLTEREWAVLRELDSDAGEKQLAERLSLSPHTLHSHIKSIYRKVGVQGRIPLLLRLNNAVRELRKAGITRVPARREPAAVGE